MGCVQILRSLLNGNIFCMSLTIAYVKGTAPGKWLTRFAERTGYGALHSFESRDPFPLLASQIGEWMSVFMWCVCTRSNRVWRCQRIVN